MKRKVFKITGILFLSLLGYALFFAFPYLFWFGVLLLPSSKPKPKDCPSEAEAKAHFYKYEAQFEELRELKQTYVAPPKQKTDSLLRLIGCRNSWGDANQVTIAYFEAGSLLSGIEMEYCYIEDIPQNASLRKRLLPLNVDIHQGANFRHEVLKHIKGNWFLRLVLD